MKRYLHRDLVEQQELLPAKQGEPFPQITAERNKSLTNLFSAQTDFLLYSVPFSEHAGQPFERVVFPFQKGAPAVGDDAEEGKGGKFVEDTMVEVAEEKVGWGVLDPDPEAVTGKIVDRCFAELADGGADMMLHRSLRNKEAFPASQPCTEVEIRILMIEEEVVV